MDAVLIERRRRVFRNGAFAEIVIWLLPRQLPGSAHKFKYRLALIDEGRCVLRYDNEAGKGDHKHAGGTETDYKFSTLEVLLCYFDAEIRSYLK